MSGRLDIIGSGIAGLASAVFAIRDAGLAGTQVTILDEAAQAGGSLDATGNAETGYVMRGERMLSPHFVCLFDLLSAVPSLDDPGVSARDDIFRFTRQNGWDSRARLVRADGSKVDATHLGLSPADRLALARLMLRSEASVGRATIQEVLPAHFFATNFWLMWCTMFAFQPWHGAVEMRRYLRRFLHLFPHLASMRTVHRTRYDQHHSIVVPLLRWLESRGVQLALDVRVADMEFAPRDGKCAVTALHLAHSDGRSERRPLAEGDSVIFCNGSMTAGSSIGSRMLAAAPQNGRQQGAWRLWQQIAAGRTDFGWPQVFCGDTSRSGWLSFTATTRTPLFGTLLERLTQAPVGQEGLITFRDSNWLLTVKANPFPHFPGQPEGSTIWWGYGLHPERTGNFVPGSMATSSGAELLRETFGHLGFGSDMDALMDASTARPCLMPYITSQFMPRAPGDRPQVLPESSANLAFVGQFCEIPDDTVFTVEYSVRSAKMAVKALLASALTIPPIYKGWRSLPVVLRAARESLR